MSSSYEDLGVVAQLHVAIEETRVNRNNPLWMWLARFGLCLAFLYSGVSKLLDFPAALAEQAHFGLNPPALFAVATITVQLGGSLLVLFGRGWHRALGALGLAGFTIVATVIGHAFWTMTGMERFHNLNSFLEHAGLVGGFVIVALLALDEPARSHSPAAARSSPAAG